MSDLPTREEVNFEHYYRYSRSEAEIKNFEALRSRLFRAYIEGTLMTREEVYDSLNLGTASDVMHKVMGLGPGVVVTSAGIDAVIDAAFGRDAE